MAMQIEYAPLFKKQFNQIMSCSGEYYSQTILKKLYADIQYHKNLLRDNPQLGAREPLLTDIDSEFRHIVLLKSFKLIYIIRDGKIYIVDLWDARQDPNKLSNRVVGSF